MLLLLFSENGIYIFLWIGASVNPEWLQNIFGVPNLAQINVETITELPDINTDESLRLRGYIRQLRNERQRYMRVSAQILLNFVTSDHRMVGKSVMITICG